MADTTLPEFIAMYEALEHRAVELCLSWSAALKYSEHPKYWMQTLVGVNDAAARGGVLETLTKLRALAWTVGLDWKLVDPDYEPRLVPPRV